MAGVEGIGELVIGIGVVLFVLVPVWATVVFGLVQIVQEEVWEKRSRREQLQLPTRDGERVH